MIIRTLNLRKARKPGPAPRFAYSLRVAGRTFRLGALPI